MTLLSGSIDLRNGLAHVLADLPTNPENRRALVSLLLDIASGQIISNHITALSCADDGSVWVKIDDKRWLGEIENVSDVIVGRINRMLRSLGREDYGVSQLLLSVSASRNKSPCSTNHSNTIELPDDILSLADTLPEQIRNSFLTWYKTLAKNNHSGNCI
jgi:hypothetical protein